MLQRSLNEAAHPDRVAHSVVRLVSLTEASPLSPRLPGQLDTEDILITAIETKVLAGFIVATVLLLVGGSYTYYTSVRYADSAAWVTHTHEVRASLASLHGSLEGAEVALRDYLLTEDPARLDDGEQSMREVRRQLAELTSLSRDSAMQQESLGVLEPLVTAELAAMTSTLQAHADFGLPAARAVMGLRRQVNTAQEVRALTTRMTSAEDQLLAARQAATAKERHTTLISLLATLAAALALFTGLFRAIHRGMLARRDAEHALRASEQYNRSIVDSSPDCLGVLTLEGRLQQLTPHGCRLLEVDDFTSIANIDWVGIWAEPYRTAAKAAIEAALQRRDGRFQGYCPTFKGTPKWWDVIVMPVLGAGGRPERLLAVSRDVTDVKRSESELREANRFLDSLVDNLPVMIAVKEVESLIFVRQNRAFEQAFGYSREEMIGKTARDLFSAEEAEFIIAKDREALEQNRLLDIPEQEVHTRHLGRRLFHTMKMPIGGEQGSPRFLLAIWTDITDRKLAEHAIHELNAALEAKAAQLTTINEELESFSYSVSHDLRAPLRAIDGFALMIEDDCSERLDAEGRRFLSVIRENSKRMGELIDGLLAFSRLGRLPVVNHEINVESLVHDVAQEVLDTPGAAARIEIGKLPAAQGDRVLLRQVWTNLISNAVKYSSTRTQPRIVVSGRQSASENLYSVRDNGVGFSMDYIDKLFGVFQRLHHPSDFAGTGVGLAIVQRIVSRHGGRVWAEGRVDEGAIFSFALPKRVSHG
ncbi:MAG: PAS domain-containing protein [Pseudomonadota bacterium]|nr:PAS domain-containing protein [Pseudomonadota bacterium]